MARKGTLTTRAVKKGPNKGKRAEMVTIKNKNGSVKNSYRAHLPESQRKRGK